MQALVKLPYWHIPRKEMEVIHSSACLEAIMDPDIDVFSSFLAL